MPSAKKPTILVVDDTDASRYATVRILKKAGYHCLEASTGNEALNIARQDPDLIVLDVHLPDILGFDVCRQLKSDAATSLIPVLHLSASFTKTDDRVAGLNCGADGYLTQPVEPQELLATVQALLRAREAERELLKLNQELEQRVQQRTNDLRELAATLIQTEQRERRRLASELHDGLAQTLVSCKIRLTLVRPVAAKDREQLCDINDALTEAIHFVRTLVSDLSPMVLLEGGLVAGLHWLADKMKEEGFNLTVDDWKEKVEMADEVLIATFRAIRELCHNSQKYSGQNRAHVGLSQAEGRLRVCVADEGVGFDPAQLRRHREGGFGLVNTRERVRLLGGCLSVDAAPGRGTRVTIEIPVESQ